MTAYDEADFRELVFRLRLSRILSYPYKLSTQISPVERRARNRRIPYDPVLLDQSVVVDRRSTLTMITHSLPDDQQNSNIMTERVRRSRPPHATFCDALAIFTDPNPPRSPSDVLCRGLPLLGSHKSTTDRSSVQLIYRAASTESC